MENITENTTAQSPLFESTTDQIRVTVLPQYIPEESNPAHNVFFYSYTVTITNESSASVQLLRRSWKITDALGETRHVDGEGVVGEQPILSPGEDFSYTSFSPLETPSGSMKGHYTFKSNQLEEFDVEIPEFFLRDSSLMN